MPFLHLRAHTPHHASAAQESYLFHIAPALDIDRSWFLEFMLCLSIYTLEFFYLNTVKQSYNKKHDVL